MLVLAGSFLGLTLGGAPPVAAQAAYTPSSFDSSLSANQSTAGTIQTVLLPGWNQVAWLGPEAPVTALFDAVPAARLAYAWDASAQRFRGYLRYSASISGLSRLTTGMGLLVLVGGDAPVEWTRPALAGSMLFSISEGWNLVSWGGPDGVPIEDALERFEGVLLAAARWNAEAGANEQYRPDPGGRSRTNFGLDHGDAMWVLIEEDALWWQSEWGTSMVVLESDLPKERQGEVRGWVHEKPAESSNQLAGNLPTNGGVGLITWGGGPVTDLVAAVQTRGCNVAEVRVTEPGGTALLRYVPTRLKQPNFDFREALPDDLPALMPALVTCARPDAPRVAFVGDVPTDLQSVFRAEIESVVEFFSARYGVKVPDFSVYVAMGLKEGVPLYLELRPGAFLGYANALGLAESFFEEEIILVLGSHDVLRRDLFARIFSHEYFHLLQRQVQQKESPHWGAGPWWLLEGTAHYADELYESAMDYDAFPDWFDGRYARLSASRRASRTYDLGDLESYQDLGLDLARIGTNYLMDRYGTSSSHIRFWQGLDDVRGWRETFADVFGVTVDDFYRDFRTHYDSLFGAIQVEIDGPLPELPGKVWLRFASSSVETGYGGSATIEDRLIRVELLPGSYIVRAGVSIKIGSWSGGVDLGSFGPAASSAKNHTIVMCQVPEEIVEVRAGETAELAVQMPVYRKISGSIRFANGDPVGNTDGFRVEVHGLSDDVCSDGVFGDSSSFNFFLPEGSAFSLQVWRRGTPVSWYGGDGLTTDQGAAATFTVSGEDLTLPDIVLPPTFVDE